MVILNNGKYDKDYFYVMHESMLGHNNETAILNQIRNINFPYLMRLDIDSNQICSIEGLATLRISQIQSLSISIYL